MEDKALILGVNGLRPNIGAAIQERLAQTIKADGMSVFGLRDLPSVGKIKRERYNILVVSLGVTHMEPFEDFDEVDLLRVVEANLIAPMIAAHRFVQATLDDRRTFETPPPTQIVFIGSYAYNHVLSNSAAYCASKAGLHMLAKSLAWELTGKNFNIFIVHPHSVQGTPMTEQVIEALMEQKAMTRMEAYDYWQKDKRLPQRLEPKEVAETVAHLLMGTATRHLSGAAIELYGGER